MGEKTGSASWLIPAVIMDFPNFSPFLTYFYTISLCLGRAWVTLVIHHLLSLLADRCCGVCQLQIAIDSPSLQRFLCSLAMASPLCFPSCSIPLAGAVVAGCRASSWSRFWTRQLHSIQISSSCILLYNFPTILLLLGCEYNFPVSSNFTPSYLSAVIPPICC